MFLSLDVQRVFDLSHAGGECDGPVEAYRSLDSSEDGEGSSGGTKEGTIKLLPIVMSAAVAFAETKTGAVDFGRQPLLVQVVLCLRL